MSNGNERVIICNLFDEAKQQVRELESFPTRADKLKIVETVLDALEMIKYL